MSEQRDQWGETPEGRSDRILARDLARLAYFDEMAKAGVRGQPADDLPFNAGYAAGLSTAQEECIRLERQNAGLTIALAERSDAFDDAVAVNNREVERRARAQEERDAALAVIEKVRMARSVILGAQNDMLGKRPDMDALEEIAMNERHIDEALAQSPASALAKVKADAWDEGVATALNHAILNHDKITLRLEHLDGRPWQNPYREEATGD